MKRFCKDMRKYFRYTIVAARSLLRAEVANSYLNWLWWILEPFCFMLIYVFIFGYVFGAKEPYFPLFIYIGVTMWDFFDRMVKGSVKIIKANKSIVTRVYLPKYMLLLTRTWVNGFKMLIAFIIVAVMMPAYQVSLTINILYALPILAVTVLFAFGCACWLMHFGVYIEDLANVVNIAMRILFYMSGIFYDIQKRVPAPYGAQLMRFNPLAFLLDGMRRALLYGQAPRAGALVKWLLISLVICAAGIRNVYRYENSYVKSI